MTFTHEPELRVTGPNTFALLQALYYEGSRDTFVVPAGFVTDFASVPRVAVWLVPRFGRYTKAAIVHDWMCIELARQFTVVARRSDPWQYVSHVGPGDVDGIFRRIMREEGVSWLLRWLVWCGVRWGALANPARRAGWWRDLPRVLPLSVLGALIVGPPAVVIIIALGLYAVLNWVTSRRGTGLST